MEFVLMMAAAVPVIGSAVKREKKEEPRNGEV